MAGLQIVVGHDFLEAAAGLPKEDRAKLVRTLALLSGNVRHPGLRTRKIQGAKTAMYECRIDQALRLIYDMEGDMLRCWHVGPHDKTLKIGAHHSDVVIEDLIVSADDRLSATGAIGEAWSVAEFAKHLGITAGD